MSAPTPAAKCLSEMTADEREVENLRQLREAIEQAKSAITSRSNCPNSEPDRRRPTDA